MLGDFKEDLKNERVNIGILYDWLECKMGVETIKDASLEEQKNNHIDFHGYLWGEHKTFEAKIRKGSYKDVLIETLSCRERQTPGWIYTSRADVLAYFFIDKGIVERGLLIYMRELRNWWMNVGRYEDYPKFYGRTGTLYTTENVACSISELPKEAIILNYGG